MDAIHFDAKVVEVYYDKRFVKIRAKGKSGKPAVKWYMIDDIAKLNKGKNPFKD
jgi:hypothetical protein